MKTEILSRFYRFNGTKNEFLKQFFIRFIRNRIIDPNTKIILDDGFKFFDLKTKKIIQIPCDDSNWCEFNTFNEGFKLELFKFPFTIKLHHDYFYTIESYEKFLEIFKKMISFRTDTIKLGWAIKYGLEYEDKSYDLLEDLNESQLITWKDPRPNATITLDMITEEDLKG